MLPKWPQHNLPRPSLHARILDIKSREWTVTEVGWDDTPEELPVYTLKSGELEKEFGYHEIREFFHKKLMTVL